MAASASTPGDRSQLMQRKLAELDEQIARAQATRVASRPRCRSAPEQAAVEALHLSEEPDERVGGPQGVLG